MSTRGSTALLLSMLQDAHLVADDLAAADDAELRESARRWRADIESLAGDVATFEQTAAS